MPIYAYRCTECGHELDVLQKISEAPLTDCPACHRPALTKKLTAAGFQLKGSGWYVTDFRDKASKKNAAGTGDTEQKGERRRRRPQPKPQSRRQSRQHPTPDARCRTSSRQADRAHAAHACVGRRLPARRRSRRSRNSARKRTIPEILRATHAEKVFRCRPADLAAARGHAVGARLHRLDDGSHTAAAAARLAARCALWGPYPGLRPGAFGHGAAADRRARRQLPRGAACCAAGKHC